MQQQHCLEQIDLLDSWQQATLFRVVCMSYMLLMTQQQHEVPVLTSKTSNLIRPLLADCDLKAAAMHLTLVSDPTKSCSVLLALTSGYKCSRNEHRYCQLGSNQSCQSIAAICLTPFGRINNHSTNHMNSKTNMLSRSNILARACRQIPLLLCAP